MTAPVLLDLFAGEGGASVGYARAGFAVIATDLAPARLKHNPHAWHVADWRDGLALALERFPVAAIHASPPCQHASAGTRTLRARGRSEHPELIEPVRDALEQTGLPYVIENVPGAALHSPLQLCGSHFALTAADGDGEPLRMERHRLFESNILLPSPGPCRHDRSVRVAGAYGGARSDKHEARHVRHGGYVPAPAVQGALLGIDWMTRTGLALSIPPAYSHHVGLSLLAHAQWAACARAW